MKTKKVTKDKQAKYNKTRYEKNKDAILEKQRIKYKRYSMATKEQKEMDPRDLMALCGYD